MSRLRISTCLFILLQVFLGSTYGFTSPKVPKVISSSTTKQSTFGYVPDGLTVEQYNKIRQQDASKAKGKDFAKVGPKGFKSRSMQAWQEAFERGEAGHTFAMVGYQEKLKKGLVRREDVPYMVRGGSWDNSDVKNAKNRLKWNKTDRQYANGGYKKEQSFSILGSGPGFDWTGQGNREDSAKRIYPGLF